MSEAYSQKPLSCTATALVEPHFLVHTEHGVLQLTEDDVWSRHDQPAMQGKPYLYDRSE